MCLEEILKFVQPLLREDLLRGHAHPGIARIVRIRISATLHVSQSLGDGLHAALSFAFYEARVTTHPFRPLRMHLLLGWIVLMPFLLELLAILVSEFSRFQIVVADRLVALALDLSIFRAYLLQSIVDLLLCPLSAPLRNLLLVSCHLVMLPLSLRSGCASHRTHRPPLPQAHSYLFSSQPGPCPRARVRAGAPL